MQICGVVSEYNPFHSGHAYHLRRVKELAGEDSAIVCCMSGNYVQRGEAALLPKHLRAKAAVSCGADLVLELPVPYALRSAEGFADSAIQILTGLGCLTALSFGAEDADASLLKETASILLEHATVQETLAQLRTGISYAAARERALYARIREKSALLQKPNNILAVEYCKAVLKQEAKLDLLPVERKGAAHDGDVSGEFASASYIREQLRHGNPESALPYLPSESRKILSDAFKNGMALTNTDRMEHMMLSTLIRLSPEQLSSLPDAAEGLENRLFESIRTKRTAEEIAQAARTKRYALSRIRRMLTCGFLGITQADTEIPAPYIRVLAFNDKGREVLRLARKQATLPLLTKPAHVEDLGADAKRIFALESLACDLYHLALPSWQEISVGADWRQDAVYVR